MLDDRGSSGCPRGRRCDRRGRARPGRLDRGRVSGSKFNGEIAPLLADLVERDLVRVLDLLVLKKDADGMLEAFELSDLDESDIGGLRDHEKELAMLLSEADVNNLA